MANSKYGPFDFPFRVCFKAREDPEAEINEFGYEVWRSLSLNGNDLFLK